MQNHLMKCDDAASLGLDLGLLKISCLKSFRSSPKSALQPVQQNLADNTQLEYMINARKRKLNQT